MILKGPDHLQPRPVADVCQPPVGVSPERTLVHASVLRPIEEGAPGLEFSHAIRRLPGVRPGHAPIAQPFPAPHGVAEMDLPIVFGAVVAERGGHPAFGHDRVCLAEQRLADESHGCAGLDGRDRRAEPCASGSDHEDVMLVAFWNLHAKVRCALWVQKSRGSSNTRIATSRMYRSVAHTKTRLNQAQLMCRLLNQLTPNHALWRALPPSVHE